MKFKYDVSHETVVDGIVYRLARSDSDVEAVKNMFVAVMLSEEPVTRSKGGYSCGSLPPSLLRQAEDILSHGVSLAAVERSSGRVVGMRTAHVIDKETVVKARPSLSELLGQFPEVHAKLTWAIDRVQWPAELFQRDASLGRLLELYGLAVLPEFRGRGVATELVKQALDVARKVECDAAVVICTNAHSKRIFDRFGFQVTNKLVWSELDVEGQRYFDDVDEPEMTVHFKKF